MEREEEEDQDKDDWTHPRGIRAEPPSGVPSWNMIILS